MSVFSEDGDFILHVGVGELRHPRSVACSDADELVVADGHLRRIVVFDVDKRARFMGDADFTGVAVHGGTIYGQAVDSCIVFT